MLKIPISEPSISWLTLSNGVIDLTTIAPIDPDSTVMGTPEKIDLMNQMITQMITSGGVGDGLVFDVRTKTIRSTSWRIPYWSAILASTLVSLWFLLPKPKTSTQMKTVEPVLVEGKVNHG